MNEHQQPEDLDLSGSEAILSGSDTASQPELTAMFDALRAPAAPSELAAAADLVPQLAAAARQSSAPGVLARSSRRMVMLGAAGAMMAGGVAAAATGALDPILPGPAPDPVVEVVELDDEIEFEIHDGHIDEEDSGVAPAPAPAEAPSVAAEMSEDPTGWFTETIHGICVEGNHGEYVSTVAQLEDDQLGEGAVNRGQVVSDAARDKDCDGEPDEKSAENEDEGEEKKDKDVRAHDDDDDEGRRSETGQGGKDKSDEKAEKAEKDKSDDD